ncbi:MAG: hypothetical protein IJ794_13250 [Lachnospiraceae bacterium]|nr:hypothetical protein [Lachnospiraceae bacterium]
MKKRAMTRLLALAMAVSMAWGGYVLPARAEEQSAETEQQQNDYIAPSKPVWDSETPGIFSWKAMDSRELFYKRVIYRDGRQDSSLMSSIPIAGEKERREDKRYCFSQSGVYTVKVFAYETDEFTDSVAESEASDEFVYTLPDVKMETPTNIRWSKEGNDYYVNCDPIENVSDYQFTLYEDGKWVTSVHTSMNSSRFFSRNYITDADQHVYTFTVEAFPADILKYAPSDVSVISEALSDSLLGTEAKEVLQSIDTAETDSTKIVVNVQTVKDLDNSDLQEAMQTNAQARENLAKLESSYAQAKGIEEKAPSSSVPSIAADQIKVVGAALNVDSGSVQLQLREADSSDNATINTAQYKSVLAFRMDVENSEGRDYSKELDVPVNITLPVPEGMNANNLKILHYGADGSVETIEPSINGDGTVMFTITHFSLFAFVDELLAQLGDINGDGAVNAKDRMYLARALAGWDGYTVPGVELADFNGDGEVNAKDRMYLARTLAGWDGYQ